METLKDTVVAITGASAGIGRATARELAGVGAHVVVGARRKARLEALEGGVPRKDRRGREGRPLARRRPASDRHRRRAVRAPGHARRQRRDRHDGSILDHSDEALTTMLDTNVAGTVWPIRAAVPRCSRPDRATS